MEIIFKFISEWHKNFLMRARLFKRAVNEKIFLQNEKIG